MPPVDRFEVLGRHMGVNLRRGDAGMAEEFLDHPKVRPMGEQVRGETMPQHVGSHMAFNPGPQHRLGHALQSVTGAKADPRLVRNTTPGLFGRTKVCRTAKYRCNAVTAAAPTGTTRSLLPLPITIRNPDSR